MGVLCCAQQLQHGRVVEKMTASDRKRLGKNIAKYRGRMRFSQEELAERAALDPRFIQKIESGVSGASIAVLQRIKRELKAEWNELLEGL
jgi:transcriptional regulator with XRE-family HTH domain